MSNHDVGNACQMPWFPRYVDIIFIELICVFIYMYFGLSRPSSVGYNARLTSRINMDAMAFLTTCSRDYLWFSVVVPLMSSVIVLLNYNGDGFYGLLKVYSCIPLGHWMLNLGNLFLCPGADESCRDARLQIPKVRPKAQPTLFVAKMKCRNDDATGRWVAKKKSEEKYVS